jgi:hypothetical protein
MELQCAVTFRPFPAPQPHDPKTVALLNRRTRRLKPAVSTNGLQLAGWGLGSISLMRSGKPLVAHADNLVRGELPVARCQSCRLACSHWLLIADERHGLHCRQIGRVYPKSLGRQL